MILLHLETKGISTAFPESVSIDFEALGPGLIALVGDNGQGKTTLLELSLPGTLFRRLPSYEESLADHLHPAVEQAYTDLSFGLGEHEYRCRVNIERGKSEAWLWRDGDPIAGEKVTDVARRVAEILPPLDVILASNFACQSRAGSLFELSRADQKKLFMELLGMKHLERLAAEAKARKDIAELALERVRERLVGARANASRAAELAREIAAGEASVAALDECLAAARAAQETAAERLAAAREDLARREAQAAEIARRREQLAAQRQTLIADEAKAAARVRTLEEALAVKDTAEGAAARVAALDTEIEQLDREAERKRAELAPIEREHAQLSERLAVLRAEHTRLNEEKTAAAAAAERVRAAGDVAERAADAAAARDAAAGDVAAAEAETAGLEAAADREQADRSKREMLTARLGDVQRRTAILDQVDVKHEMCAVCPLAADARETAATLEQLEAELGALPAVDGRPSADALRNHRSRLQTLREAQAKAASAAAAAEKAVSDLRGDQVLAGKLAESEAAIAANVQSGKSTRATVLEIEERRDALQQQLTAATERRQAAAGARQAELQTAQKVAEVRAAEAQIDEARDTLQALRGRIELVQGEEKETAAPDLTQAKADLDGAATAAATATETVRSVEAERRPQAEALQRAIGERQALGDPATELVQLEDDEKKLALDASDWAHLERAFGQQGIQALEVDAAGPSVTALANELLTSCYGSRFQVRIDTTEPSKTKKGVNKEVFDVVILDAEDPTGQGRKSASGGELAILDKCVRWGISLFNRLRAGTPLLTLFCDEVDGALSAENASRFVQMLRRVREIGGFHQVVFISHNPDVYAQADARLFVAGGRVTVDEVAEAA